MKNKEGDVQRGNAVVHENRTQRVHHGEVTLRKIFVVITDVLVP
jgi:hypothetical protein